MKYIVELTNDCNLKCGMCPRNYIDMKIGYMSEETWKNTIEKIPYASTILPFWRGESTLHPEFREMVKGLKGYDVVLATNGTNPDVVIDVMPYLSAINVSLHNEESYDGYKKIVGHISNGRPTVIASMVEEEIPLAVVDRVYKKHTVNGIWGKVEGIERKNEPTICERINESIFSWDGKVGKCCYVWDVVASSSVCSTCSQWMGYGKTL